MPHSQTIGLTETFHVFQHFLPDQINIKFRAKYTVIHNYASVNDFLEILKWVFSYKLT